MEENKAPQSAPKKDNDMLMYVLSYIGILFLIPLFAVNPKSDTLKFHLRQGIALFIVEVLLNMVTWFMPMLGIITLIPVIAAIYAIIEAVNGRKWEIPVIGEYAKKINI